MSKKSSGGSSRNRGPAPKPIEVRPHPDGWQAKRQGADRAITVTETKKEALDRGREVAQRDGSELVIKGKDNRVQDKDSHGHESPKHDRDGHKK